MKGNQMKMREALEDMYNILEKLLLYTPQIKDVSLMRAFRGRVCRAKKIVDASLSAPARQCDVGTAEEKYRRWVHFFEQRLHICHNCEINSPVGCTFKFGDMPYEAEEGNNG